MNSEYQTPTPIKTLIAAQSEGFAIAIVHEK